MLTLTWFACTLFEPDNTDAPPDPPRVEVTDPIPEPVPRDTADRPDPVELDSISGTWAGDCALSYGGYVPFAFGGSGTTTYGGSGGYYAQTANVEMQIVEVEGGRVFGGATIEIGSGYDGYQFGAGVTGTRDEEAVDLAFAIGKFAVGQLDATWDRAEDALLGTLTFGDYGVSGDCRLDR